MKVKLWHLSLFISCSSILYFLRLPLSPVYIISPILIFAYTLFLFEIKTRKDLLIFTSTIIFCGIILICQLMILSNYGMLLNTILSLLIFVFLYNALSSVSKDEFERVVYLYVLFVCLVCCIETIYRLNNPLYIEDSLLAVKDLFIYPYKRNSIMFVDSNYTAVLLLISLVMFDNVLIKIKQHKILYCFLIVLLMLTFSRSAIITFIFLKTVDFIKGVRCSILIKYAFCTLLICILMMSSLIILSDFSLNHINDGSLLSKFKLLEMMYNIYEDNGLSFIVFGGGIGNSESLIGMGAHNILVLMFLEYGAIFYIPLLFFILFSLKYTKLKLLKYWVAMFISGMSLGFFLAFVFIPVSFYMASTKYSRV